jgi:ribosomal protein S18 acetylase RimI-like enzyme
MSRDQIEMGLAWRWTPSRVAEQIHCPDTVVLIAGDQKAIAGFAIMYFGEEIAHLNLLAVKESHQRLGIGSRLLNWLEESSIVAGVATVELEVRARNRGAHAFYKSLGYEEVRLLPGYYSGRESAIQMARFLRMSEGLNEWLRHR